MRITFVLPFAGLSGGVRVVATYAQQFTKQGHEVYVLSARRAGQSLLRTLWLRLTLRAHKIRPKPPSPFLDFLGARHIRYRPNRPLPAELVPDADVVVATWWRTAREVANLPESKGKKFYLIQDYEAFEFQPVDEVAASYRLPLRKIAVSSYIRDQIAKRHGVEDITVINNAVELQKFTSAPRSRSKRFTVGFLYNSHPRKRCDLAIEALEQAHKSLPELRVIVFGGRPPSSRLPLPDWMEYHLAPTQDDIPKLYQSCDVWLFPSAQEGFGLPLLEAMASRTPVIASPAGAAPDLIDNRNGSLLPKDAGADRFCAEILRFAALSPDQWHAYSEAAYVTARQNDWEHSANRFIREMRSVLEATTTEPKAAGSLDAQHS